MNPENQAVLLARGDVLQLMFGTVFVSFGLVVWFIAAVRRGRGMRLLIWVGVWTAIYGLLRLTQTSTFPAILPPSLRATVPFLNALSGYFTVVVGTMAFRELALGAWRWVLSAVVLVGSAIGIAGMLSFAAGSPDRFVRANNLLTACSLAVLLIVLLIPGLARKSFVLDDRGVITVATLIFALEALLANSARPFGIAVSALWDNLGFAILLLAFAYVGTRQVMGSEHRLVAIESELEIARRLQFSILPEATPVLRNTRIAAAYHPMTAVAGDFYEFLPVDVHHAGFLVADVSGHGVPAALIASMIKVAVQTVSDRAQDPGQVLHRLGAVLSAQLRGQFVSAAYLWLDSDQRKAKYSAAGHPPLLCWRAAKGSLERIESNGLLYGVMADGHYPVCELALSPGDRLLLYTDGITEPENRAGEAFGDQRLEQILRENQSSPARELSDRLLAGMRAWQPATSSQQDDMTLVVIDVL